MVDRWRIAKEGQEIGPFNLGALQHMAAAGSLRPEDVLDAETGSERLRASEIPQIFPEGLTRAIPLQVKTMQGGPSPDNPQKTADYAKNQDDSQCATEPY